MTVLAASIVTVIEFDFGVTVEPTVQVTGALAVKLTLVPCLYFAEHVPPVLLHAVMPVGLLVTVAAEAFVNVNRLL